MEIDVHARWGDGTAALLTYILREQELSTTSRVTFAPDASSFDEELN